MALSKDKLNKRSKACTRVILRRSRETIVGVEKQELLHILSVCL